MKHFIIFIILIAIFPRLSAQNKLNKKNDDEARIVLNTFIPDDILKEAPHARKLFYSKLAQIASLNGVGGSKSDVNSRFIISGNLNVLTKDIMPTSPPKYLVTIETTLAIGDGVDGKAFATEYIEFKGIGGSDDKAFLSAIKKVNPRHRMVKQLVEEGKKKIIEYYNSKCDFIAKTANTQKELRQFDLAIYTLSQVPNVCRDCFETSMDLAARIAEEKFEFECQSKISETKALIVAGEFIEASKILTFYNKDMVCSVEIEALLSEINGGLCSKYLGEAKGYWSNRDSKSAASSLAKINASLPCYNESVNLSNEISSYLDEKDQREWDLEYEKYKDAIAIKNRNLDNYSNRINAIREIGVAYGKNQPRSVTYSPIIR